MLALYGDDFVTIYCWKEQLRHLIVSALVLVTVSQYIRLVAILLIARPGYEILGNC